MKFTKVNMKTGCSLTEHHTLNEHATKTRVVNTQECAWIVDTKQPKLITEHIA